MKWFRTVIREIFGLFVDDGSFALAILVWLGLAGWASRHFSFEKRWSGAVLFFGLAFLLMASATRFAVRARSRRAK